MRTAELAEARLLAEIERLRDEPVTEAELAKAKRALEVGLIAGQGSSNALASRIAEDYIAFGRIRTLEERLAKIRAVDAADVERVARTWLVPGRPQRRAAAAARRSAEGPVGASRAAAPASSSPSRVLARVRGRPRSPPGSCRRRRRVTRPWSGRARCTARRSRTGCACSCSRTAGCRAFALGVVSARGAGVETPDEAGVAAFTAELMERGAGERNALELARGGGRARRGPRLVSSDWDAIRAQVSGLSRDQDALFDVLADVVLRPRFDADEAKRVQSEQLAALRQAADDPVTLLSWHLAQALYPGHRYGLPEVGSPGTAVAPRRRGGARLPRAHLHARLGDRLRERRRRDREPARSHPRHLRRLAGPAAAGPRRSAARAGRAPHRRRRPARSRPGADRTRPRRHRAHAIRAASTRSS